MQLNSEKVFSLLLLSVTFFNASSGAHFLATLSEWVCCQRSFLSPNSSVQLLTKDLCRSAKSDSVAWYISRLPPLRAHHKGANRLTSLVEDWGSGPLCYLHDSPYHSPAHKALCWQVRTVNKQHINPQPLFKISGCTDVSTCQIQIFNFIMSCDPYASIRPSAKLKLNKRVISVSR